VSNGANGGATSQVSLGSRHITALLTRAASLAARTFTAPISRRAVTLGALGVFIEEKNRTLLKRKKYYL